MQLFGRMLQGGMVAPGPWAKARNTWSGTQGGGSALKGRERGGVRLKTVEGPE